jgi:hypothetical protein
MGSVTYIKGNEWSKSVDAAAVRVKAGYDGRRDTEKRSTCDNPKRREGWPGRKTVSTPKFLDRRSPPPCHDKAYRRKRSLSLTWPTSGDGRRACISAGSIRPFLV